MVGEPREFFQKQREWEQEFKKAHPERTEDRELEEEILFESDDENRSEEDPSSSPQH